VETFLVSVPQAAALWVLMLVGAVLLAGVLARRTRPAEPVITEADSDARRYAGEVSVAAGRAAATAERRRADWVGAQRELDAAWLAFDAADQVARQAAKALAYPLMSRRRKPGENVERQRYLHHAASAACRNREISIAQLNDVYAHRGWNPRLHPVVQEPALKQAIRDHRWAEYQAALAKERKAWQEAEFAAEALRSLRLEASAAVTRAGAGQPAGDEQWWADAWTTAELPAAA
jgi:phosphatidylserine/phosphatidylglycerophosphate/cardiolipin synthase-like enzyme